MTAAAPARPGSFVGAGAGRQVKTAGIDHVGLTVVDVRKSAAFFTECLGWQIVGERPAYPAIFVSDGRSRVTLWEVADRDLCSSFDRRRNVGLHHLAIRVGTAYDLVALHAAARAWEGVTVEFDPELSGSGPKIHSMFREPGGCRIELCWIPPPLVR